MSAIRDTIYNNYLLAYQPQITRYDSHKKSELRSTYNSIVKINKESPWYLPVTSTDAQTFAIDLKESARALRGSIAELGGLEENGMLNKKSAYSSDPDIATAEYIGDESNTDEVPSFELSVKQLASSQENTGTALADRATALPEDTYSFDISINDMNYEFQFAISDGESNKAIQERLSRLINNSGIGLKSSILEADGRYSLQITSEATGIPQNRDSIFVISDNHTSKTSGAVAYFGLDNITRSPANAEFQVNGEDRSASSNHFTVGKMYELNLVGVSAGDKATTIGIKTDTESVSDNVNLLIGSYNSFLRSVGNYLETQSKSKRLMSELGGITGAYGDALAGLGVTLAEDGTLEVDDDKLKAIASESGDLNSTLQPLKDFSKSLLRKSNQITLNPMDYVQRTIVAYKNPGHNFVSPYSTSAYSGMMYNFYC